MAEEASAERSRVGLSFFAGSTGLRRFAALAMLLGCAYLVINPPFAVNDEDVHLARIYELSMGRLVTRSDADGEYHEVPKDYLMLGARYQAVPRRRGGRVHAAKIGAGLTKPRPEGDLVHMKGRAGRYAPLAYHVQVPIIWLARHFDVGVLWHMYLARLGSLLVYLWLAHRAASEAGNLRLAFMVLAMMPMVLTQAAGVSSDGLIIGLTFLFFALIAKRSLLAGAPATLGERIQLVVCLALITLCKPVYLLAGVALLALHWSEPAAHWKRWGFAFGALLAAVALSLSWSQIASSEPSPPDPSHSVSQQLALLWADPPFAARLLWDGLVARADELLVQSVFARYRIAQGMRISGGIASAFYALLLFALSWGMSRGRDELAGRPRMLRAALFMACWLAVVLAVPSALYLCCTIIGRHEVRGFQGRYLIPAFPALLLAVSLFGRPRLGAWLSRDNRVVVGIVIAANLLCLLDLIGWHYYGPEAGWPQ
jgi:uncharacterized membrane protein